MQATRRLLRVPGRFGGQDPRLTGRRTPTAVRWPVFATGLALGYVAGTVVAKTSHLKTLGK